MNKKLPQISLDFGPEPEPSPNPPAGEKGQATDPLTTQYMAAGVGVRIKSLKTPKTLSSEPQPVTGNLFGNTTETAPMPPPAVTENAPAPTPAMTEPALHIEPAPVTETTALTTEPIAPTESASTEILTATQEREQPVPAESAPVSTVPEQEQPNPADPTPVPEPEPTPLAETPTITSPIPRIPRRKERVTTPAGSAETPKSVKSKRGRKSLKQVTAEADLIEIPADEALFSKQYYTMGEVSEMFRVNQSLLRFWETEFDILQPRKNKKGDRYFRPVDIKNLHLIYHLLRQRKYTIEGAKEFLKKNKNGEERFETIQRLQEIKAFLQEWKAHINF